MERCVIAGSLLCSRLCRASSRWWRHPSARKSAVVAGLCFVYLFFAVLQVSSSPSDGKRRIDSVPLRHNDAQKTQEPPTATRSNVLYITLRSKRQRPAVIRATVRPKLRKKKAKTLGEHDARVHGGKGRHNQDAWAQKRTNSTDAWTQIIHRALVLYKSGRFEDDYPGNSIRLYSQKPPPWFSPRDMAQMRLLSNSKVAALDVLQPEGSPSVLMFRSDVQASPGHPKECTVGCGVIKPPVDMSEVFAFHLDRVLGLNRSLPTVSRRFKALDGQLCPVTQWDPSITPLPGHLTWSSYQTSLKHKCWQRGAPKPEWNCSTIHHYEWSKMALFDFLLQIHQRLDRNCCGFRPRPEDSCVIAGYHGECGNMDNVELSSIVLRRTDPRHLVFFHNKGFFDRDEENLDFKLLEGIKELPDVAVGVLSSQRLREKLLQSLFLDQFFWESQGGRQGVEKLIDVIERRARVLLRYINAHGIKVIPMNT
ncbi:Golgi-associated kinase 1B [Hoplias malabaricus]|uniref:Golgi-associated kinase 1B n=1 Tax=Hoplias malabaricus TaxID=27720 RepID=UPI00346290A3